MMLLNDLVAEAMEALKQSENQFALYANHHLDKKDTEKAQTNYKYAMMCHTAHEKLRIYRDEM